MSEKSVWDWDFVVLQPLSHGKPMHLKDIYAAIEDRRGMGGINEKLFKVDGRWGDRKDYTHSVRSTMDSLRKRVMVEHLGKGRTGMYQITAAGQKRLSEIEP
jgi:hypothetical protein